MSLAPQSHAVTAIRLSDRGDGSTGATILFKDGSELHASAQVWADAQHAEAIVKDGVVGEFVNYDHERNVID